MTVTNTETRWQRVRRRAKAQTTFRGKVGKYLGHLLFDSDLFDDMEETCVNYILAPGISREEKLRRCDEIRSMIR